MFRIRHGSRKDAAVRRRSPSLLRFLGINLAIGATVAVLVVAGLILSDSHQLGRLIQGDESPVVAVVMLIFGFVITFGSAAMGAAIMGLPYGEGNDGAGHRAATARGPDGEAGLVQAKAAAVARR